MAFHAQIQSERIRLVALSAALAGAEVDHCAIYDDLTSRAHRLQSGAETLELTEVAAAASSLKLAARCASLSHADNTDTTVWTALVALVSAMGTLAPA